MKPEFSHTVHAHFVGVIRFALASGFNAGVETLTFAVLIYFGMAVVPANILAGLVSILVGYLIHRRWTFRARAGNALAQIVRFLITGCGAIALSTALVSFFAVYMAPLLAKILSLPITFIYSYAMNRFWAFYVHDVL